MNKHKRTSIWSGGGLSLVEILIAIGILAVAMTLIAAAFPAGVVMSIAVSDETTAQSVFQKALAEIKDNLARSHLSPDTDNYLVVMPEPDATEGGFQDIEASRKLSSTSFFSWAALVKPVDPSSDGPLGNLCQVVVVVSRRPSGDPEFVDENGLTGPIPELRSVYCTASNVSARTITLRNTVDEPDFELVPSQGIMIDGKTGTAYLITQRNDGASTKTVTLLSVPPNSERRDFWVVPGPVAGPAGDVSYGRKTPAVRVFQALLYLP